MKKFYLDNHRGDDVMQINEEELSYPVPWAKESSTSKLGTPAQYKQALNHAGWSVSEENVRSDFALEYFDKECPLFLWEEITYISAI